MYKKFLLLILLIQKTNAFARGCLLVTNKSSYYKLIAIRRPKFGVDGEDLYFAIPTFPNARFIPFDGKKYVLQILDSEYLSYTLDKSKTKSFDFVNNKHFHFTTDIDNKLFVFSSDNEGLYKNTQSLKLNDTWRKKASEFLAKNIEVKGIDFETPVLDETVCNEIIKDSMDAI